MAKEWEMAAYAGDHYRLAFDQPDSWGMKYNLVWDRLLGLNLFPERVIQKETDFYLTKMNELDVRWIADIVIRKWIGQYGLLR